LTDWESMSESVIRPLRGFTRSSAN
jgi:hypothetical protein